MKHDLKTRRDQAQTAAPVALSSATLKPMSHQENIFNSWVEKMNAVFQLWNTALAVYDLGQEQIGVIDKEAQKAKLQWLSVTGSHPGLLCMSLRRPFIRKSPLGDSKKRNNTWCLKSMLRSGGGVDRSSGRSCWCSSEQTQDGTMILLTWRRSWRGEPTELFQTDQECTLWPLVSRKWQRPAGCGSIYLWSQHWGGECHEWLWDQGWSRLQCKATV